MRLKNTPCGEATPQREPIIQQYTCIVPQKGWGCMNGITRQDLAFIIKSAKKQMGWTLKDMAEVTGIPFRSLEKYATKTRFPKNPEIVIDKIRRAIKEERKHVSDCKGLQKNHRNDVA